MQYNGYIAFGTGTKDTSDKSRHIFSHCATFTGMKKKKFLPNYLSYKNFFGETANRFYGRYCELCQTFILI